ncbi:hypothetical protein EBESD8_54900 [Rhodococcus aetherivorans]|nr:hypothetical protein EBESD8_54900 [Rhodococcus aetherivorans]
MAAGGDRRPASSPLVTRRAGPDQARAAAHIPAAILCTSSALQT